MRLISRAFLAALALLLAVMMLPVQAQRAPSDWTQWRGPNRDGAAPAPADPKAWPEKLTQKWKVEVGTGYATPSVVGNRIYQFSRQGEREVMSALDADTGKVLWQTGHDAPFTMHSATTQHGPGPKSTPAFADGRLYSIGMTGIVTAYDADVRQAGLAEARHDARAHVHDACVLTPRGSRAGHLSRRR